MKLRHIGLVTYNLSRSLNFWKNYIGFKYIVSNKLEDGNLIDKILKNKKTKIRSIKLKNKNNEIVEIIYPLNFNKKKKKLHPLNNGITHISITVNNLNSLYAKLRKRKVIFHTKPTLSLDKKVLMTYCKTPENCFLELVEPTNEKL
jgi:hypothetical protein